MLDLFYIYMVPAVDHKNANQSSNQSINVYLQAGDLSCIENFACWTTVSPVRTCMTKLCFQYMFLNYSLNISNYCQHFCINIHATSNIYLTSTEPILLYSFRALCLRSFMYKYIFIYKLLQKIQQIFPLIFSQVRCFICQDLFHQTNFSVLRHMTAVCLKYISIGLLNIF